MEREILRLPVKNIELTEWWIFSDIVTSHFDKVTEQQIQRK